MSESTRWRVQTKVGLGFGLALTTLLVIGIVSYHTVASLIGTAKWVAQAHQVLEHLSDLESQTNEIESGARGYVITFEESYLEPFNHGVVAVRSTIKELSSLIVDVEQQRRLQEIGPLLDERIALAQETVKLRRSIGFSEAARLIETGRGKELTAEIQRRLVEMGDREEALLEQRRNAAQLSADRTYYTLITGSLLCTVILGAAASVIFADIRRKRESEQALQKSNEDLQRSLCDLEQRTQEISRLGQIGDLLHLCQTVDEAYQVIAHSMPRMLPSSSGALIIIGSSRNLVELAVSWGQPRLGEPVFPPDDCWALRRGRMHFVADPDSGMHCRHLGSSKPDAYLCLPLMAHGETVGLFHLQSNNGDASGTAQTWVSEAGQKLVATVAGQIALAVANLKLREALRQQSIRDPLTGLFNRRYLEESLDLELRRARRSSRALGVFMLDLDHFKRFNDSFGHDAGDSMLRELSAVLKGGIRSFDVACRYGGEEFALILPEANLEACRIRAEELRESVKHLNVQHRGQGLGNVTISIGIAAFPDHGDEVETLLHAADTALYRAKKEGRDRVVIAGGLVPQGPVQQQDPSS